MALRQLRYNDDEILRKRCREVDEVNDHIRMILDDMLDTLHNTKDGAALAACQVGILKRLVVIDMGKGVYKLVNPVIIETMGEQRCVEGCLSFPNRTGIIVRPQKVIVKALDENGREIIVTGKDEMAQCLSHEIDHLDGIVFIDKVIRWVNK